MTRHTEYRHDPLHDRWVIVAPGRTQRPDDFRSTAARPDADCPFCPGNEQKTPPEILRVGGPGVGQWSLRVVPNKFPALVPDPTPASESHPPHARQDGTGVHEVIIETPHHHSPLATRPPVEVKTLLEAYRGRLQHLHTDKSLQYVLIFKNSGDAAGASLRHPHSQIVATTLLPRAIAEELDACEEHYLARNRCLFCEIVEGELLTGTRVVSVDSSFALLCPYAARFPFEMLIVPRRHGHDFTELTEGELADLARTLTEALGRLRAIAGDVPFNYFLHTAPNPGATPRDDRRLAAEFHWHIELIPRTVRVAGFEWGTEMFINPVAPEDAAEKLRSVAVSDLGDTG